VINQEREQQENSTNCKSMLAKNFKSYREQFGSKLAMQILAKRGKAGYPGAAFTVVTKPSFFMVSRPLRKQLAAPLFFCSTLFPNKPLI